MFLIRHVCSVGLALLLAGSLYPCDIVVIGGYTPAAIRQVSGTIVGSGRIDLMGHRHDKERHSLAVPGAKISVKTRTDTAFFKKGEIKYPPGAKPSTGNLKEWRCGDEVSSTTADEAGDFRVSQLEPGKYCLDITAPEPKDKSELSMHASFIVDVVASAPNTALVADISPLWPDCSGGSSLELKTLDGTRSF